MKDIAGKVIHLVADVFGVDESSVNRGSTFVGDLDADSLDVAELLLTVEEQFDVTISIDDAPIVTVGDLIDFIEGGGPGAAGVGAKLPPRTPPPSRGSAGAP